MTPQQQEEGIMSEDKRSDWYKIKLGATYCPDSKTSILRVPGGWVVTVPTYNGGCAVFVPFDNEFMGGSNEC